MLKQCFITIGLIISASSLADNNAHQNHGDHHHSASQPAGNQQPHLHGTAELTLALEANRLAISLASPAANIVGFEHTASSESQKQTVAQAKSLLEASSDMFTFSGGECHLSQAAADMSALTERDEDEHHQHHDEHQNNHSEINASYFFECQQGQKLQTVTVNLFHYFTGLETLNVSWLTDHQQGASELTANSRVIRLR
ncbi:hypothetical protein SIN8267_02494 [Sinobacterium norvegicum]|uniref:DUF2796 domain-containing protein n=1 Tax=Sinobacterium norvegicum TaxID=1641715 RepID=A0ABN8EIZ5_9GAMM|nr:DUF2796 domain-containing protein [Sinobacterium norvegicum]CAH0992375.1 hypothetical protein SIN8267_02494 [Sinobacterium norvegicum]